MNLKEIAEAAKKLRETNHSYLHKNPIKSPTMKDLNRVLVLIEELAKHLDNEE